MSYLGVFSACFLALVAFKFAEPWLDAMRNKVMGWDKAQRNG